MKKAKILIKTRDGNCIAYANKFLAPKTGNDNSLGEKKGNLLFPGFPTFSYYYTGFTDDSFDKQTKPGQLKADYEFFKKQLGNAGKLKFPETDSKADTSAGSDELIRDNYRISVNLADVVSISISEEETRFPYGRESGYMLPVNHPDHLGFQETKERKEKGYDRGPDFNKYWTEDNGYIPNPIIELDDKNKPTITNEKEFTKVVTNITSSGIEAYGVREIKKADGTTRIKKSGTTYANFHPVACIINRKVNNKNITEIEDDTIKVYAGQKIDYGKFEDTEKYAFKEWTLDTDGKNKVPEITDEDMTIYAQWTEKHIVTKNLNYEGAPDPEKISFKEGSAIVLGSNPTRKGYDFVKWSLNPDGTGDVPNTMPANDITVYAQWTKKTHKFIKKFEDGITEDEVVSMEEGANLSYGNIPTREGYDFKWWSSSQNGEDNAPAVMGESDIIVYAVWNRKAHKLIKNFNDGVTPDEESLVEEGANINYGDDPAREGYIFSKWSLDINGASDAPTVMGKTDITVYVIWSKNKHKVTKKFNDGITPDEEFLVEEGVSIDYYPDPVREGYDFVKWTIDEKGLEDAPINMGESDIIVYAQWKVKEIVKHNLKKYLNYEGAPKPEVIQLKAGDPISLDPAQVEGRTFIKWSADISGTKEVPAVMTDYDLNVYAQWQSGKHKFTKDLNYEDAPAPQVIELSEGDPITYGVPTRAGGTFTKWTNDKNGFDVNVPVYMGGNDITLYAQWEELPKDTVLYKDLEAHIASLQPGNYYRIIDATAAPVGDFTYTTPATNSEIVNKLNKAPQGVRFDLAIIPPVDLTDVTGCFEGVTNINSVKFISK